MRGLIIIIIGCIVISQISFAQTTFPRGAYVSYDELLSKKPSIPFAFKLKEKTINGVIGAKYKFVCTDGSVMLFEIENKIYAISTGENLYLNCFFQEAGDKYAKVISEGKHLAFQRLPAYVDDKNNENSNGKTKQILTRYLFIVSEYGITLPMNRVRLRKMMNPYPDLLNQYLNEPNMDDQEIMLHYFLIVNEK